MWYIVADEIRPFTWAVSCFSDDGTVRYRTIATKKNEEEVKNVLRKLTGRTVNLYFLRINVPDWAKKLPGVWNIVPHPVTKNKQPLFNIIMDLNDNQEWSREQIADWIETLDDVPTFKV